MSQGTWGFAIDLDELRSAIGSGDARLLATIEERNAEYLGWDESWRQEGETSVRQALASLVRHGDALGNVAAVDLLCLQLGVRLEDDDDILGDMSDLDVPSSLFTTATPLVKNVDDRIKSVPVDRIGTELEQLRRLPPHDDDDIEAGRAVLRSFYERAGSLGKALVTLTG